MKHNHSKNAIFLLFASLILGPGLAFAQLEEVIVTASKRGAVSLQDVPFSVQALSGDRLEAIGATDFNDFFRLIPGLAVFDQGPGDKRIILRGVNATGAGTVGLYLDEVIITGENAQDGGGRQPDIKLFDIERVEVLKGPQGTTFGSSSLSGTIRYITKKPDLEQRTVDLGVTFTDIRGADDLSGQAEVALNLPVIDDRLAVRLAGYYLNQDGFIDNRFGNGVNSDETTAGRISALFTPTEHLNISLMAMIQNTESDGPAYFNRVDGARATLPPNTQADLSANPFDDEITLYNATVEYLAPLGTVTATASRYERDTVFNRDASLVVGPNSVITQPKDREVNSYELRFASNWDGPLQTLVGVFAQNEDRIFQSRIFPADPSTGRFTEVPRFSLDRNVRTEIDEIALFAELSYEVTERLTLTGGLRWFDIDVEEVANAVQGFSGAPGAGVGPLLTFGEDDVIGKVNVSWRSTDSVMLFAQWSQGFRSGGTNDQTAAQIANVIIPQGFGSDSLDNYEIGIKSDWMDGRLIANTSFYYIDWADIQIQDQAQNPDNVAQFFPFRSNGGGADIFGAEFELITSPVDGLNLTLVGSWNDAQLSEDNPIPASGRDGDTIPYTPEWSFSFSTDYTWPLTFRNLKGAAGLDVSYVDDRTTELRPTNPLNFALDSYTLVGARVGVQADDWSAMLSVNNLFDEDKVIDVFRIIPGLTPDGFIPLQPRNLSLILRKSF